MIPMFENNQQNEHNLMTISGTSFFFSSIELSKVVIPKGAAIVITSKSAASMIGVSIFGFLPLLFHFYRS
ncbi:hypothetical protein ANTPLA_LOCUS4425 [Anthophora plagiata]